MSNSINYREILNRLLRDYPHDLDKIEKVIKDAKENGEENSVKIEFKEIITNIHWNADEKARLINMYGYNKRAHIIEYMDYRLKRIESLSDVNYLLRFENKSGFEALMKAYQHNDNDICSRGYNSISKDQAYRRAIDAVIGNCKEELKKDYLKCILDNLTEDDIRRLIKPRYVASNPEGVRDISIFTSILASKDLSLVKKYIKYVEDINLYMSEAVATGNIDIVKLFLEKGADVNYLPEEVVLGKLTPLKTAIANNDYEMAKFLIDNGADINLQDNCPDFIDKLKNHQIDISDIMNIIKNLKEDDKNVKELRYIRESSPLQYATKLNEHYRRLGFLSNKYSFTVYFNGELPHAKNELYIETFGEPNKQVINRGKIIDLIYDNLQDKSKVDYTDLLIYAIMSKNTKMFEKYTEDAKKAEYPINFDLLFKLYFELTNLSSNELTDSLFKLIDKYDKDSNLYTKLMNYYMNYKRDLLYKYEFSINAFTEKLLNKIPEENRKEICLVPYCKNLQTLEGLIKLGFDINQVDKEGKNILYNLLISRGKYDDLNDEEIELFNYLIENLDLSKKDKDNKTILYYAMKTFPTEKEFDYAEQEKTLSKLESAIARLISKMSKEDVCNDDIKFVLEQRIEYESGYGDKIEFGYVYHHHRELFEALVNKGFVFGDKILKAVFEPFYEECYEYKRRGVNVDNSLEFIYKNLDYNTETQELPIENDFHDLMNSLNNKQTKFEDFVQKLKEFNMKNQKLDEFYEKEIKEKFRPEYYLDFAKKKYHTIYGYDKASFITHLVLKGTNTFGFDKLPTILEQVPDYDINSYLVDADIGYSYWTYFGQINEIIDIDDDGAPIFGDSHFAAERVKEGPDEQVMFTGGLMQYAILTDNLPMVKYLREKGASLELTLNGENLTWNYVNSYEMLAYLESILGSKEYSGLCEEEVDYLKELFSSTDSSETDNQKVMVKKDDSSNGA